ncbi:MAG: hypothetical protein PHD26_04075 [Methanosarcinaceae archaeon]|nr:hypothetical protein [Methanosarcinaceae archaeon]
MKKASSPQINSEKPYYKGWKELLEKKTILSVSMNPKAIITIAILISAILLATELSPIVNTEQIGEGDYIHFDLIEIKFDGPDANVTVHYQLTRPFAQTYMFLFGSKHLESKIKDLFFDFEEVELLGIGKEEADIRITNISRLKDNKYFLHDSRKLGTRFESLITIDPDGSKAYFNVEATPDTYYRVEEKA